MPEKIQEVLLKSKGGGSPDTEVGIEADIETEAATVVGTAVELDSVVDIAAMDAGIESEAAGIE
jgi:hypothetical protein